MASPVPACVSAVFDERLARMIILVTSPEHIAANEHVARDGFYKGFLAPLLAAFYCSKSTALMLPDDYEAMALDKIHKYVALQLEIQDLTSDEMFDEARDEVKMHDYMANRACAVGEGWQGYCDEMKGKYNAFMVAVCELLDEARATPRRTPPLTVFSMDFEDFFHFIEMAYHVRMQGHPHYKMAALRIIVYMLIDINYRQANYSWHSGVFHEYDVAQRNANARDKYIHGRMMKRFVAVLALEADEWMKARHMLDERFRSLAELGQVQGL